MVRSRLPKTRGREAWRLIWPAVLAVVLVLTALYGTVRLSENRVRRRSPIEETVKQSLSGLSVPFVANSGQADTAVAYYASTFAGAVFVTQNGEIVYSLPGETGSAARPGRLTESLPKGNSFPSSSLSPARESGWSLTETPVGGRAHPSGTIRGSTRVSYFLGADPARWRSGLPTFDGLFFGEVWPGVTLDVQARGNNVEKRFTVKPGGEPSRIRMCLAGARRLRVDESGALVVGTGPGEVTFTPPVAFQERHGVRHAIRAAYELHGREYGFRLGDYDPALPVLIDPLLQATYLGGSGTDYATALAIDPTTGDVYVAGQTQSTNFPGTGGGAQSANGGNSTAFVARLNTALTTLDQATYLGGSGSNQVEALTIHPITGDVYVAGYTQSADFPGTGGGAQPGNGGSYDAFVVRLNAALTTLNQATYLGGGGFDLAYALAIHPTTGDVYVAGDTTSTNFPGTGGGAQPGGGGFRDAFVARLNAGLTTLDQATYLGGSNEEHAFALAIHPTTGDVYIAGLTQGLDFPGTGGGAQPGSGGSNDAFTARFNAALTTLVQATYLGGTGDDQASALAIDPTTGDVYVAGQTRSTNFPGTGGGAQSGY